MKNYNPNSGYFDLGLENLIRKKDEELKAHARKTAIHLAKTNLPRPVGDNLSPYIGNIKGGYETLAAEVLHRIQPASHAPEARIEVDYAREKDKILANEIAKKEQANNNDAFDLGEFHPGNIGSRIWTALILTFIIFIGDGVFNTKAFQVTGENLLFALILSISISFSVYVLTHLAPLLYKRVTTQLKRIAIVIISLVLATALFIALSIFRSQFLATNGVTIKPVYFVIINLFFFIVSALLSYYILPDYEEIQQHWILFKRHQNIRKRTKEIEKLKNERANLRSDLAEKATHHTKTMHNANYLTLRINKMYKESVEIFKSTNIAYRIDGQTPDCFYGESPDADITYSLTAPKQ